MSIRRVPCPGSGAVPFMMLRGAHLRHTAAAADGKRSAAALGSYAPY